MESLIQGFSKSAYITLSQIADALQRAKDFQKQGDYAAAEAVLWAAYDEGNHHNGEKTLSTFLGEAPADLQDIAEQSVEILSRLGALYEETRQYREGATCYHKAIPVFDRYDTYAWSRCFSLQSKYDEKSGITHNSEEWEAMMEETWKGLLREAQKFKEAGINATSHLPPPPPSHTETTTPQQTNITADAPPVYVAA